MSKRVDRCKLELNTKLYDRILRLSLVYVLHITGRTRLPIECVHSEAAAQQPISPVELSIVQNRNLLKEPFGAHRDVVLSIMTSTLSPGEITVVLGAQWVRN